MTDLSSATTMTDSGIARNLDLPRDGLTEPEARASFQRGEGNNAGICPSRTYWDIARANLFTLFNNILFLIGAEKVGAESYANKLAATARQFQATQTPLPRQIDLIVRTMMLVVVVMSITILVASLLESLSTVRLVQIAAVLSGPVPYGLFLMIVVASALGASTTAKKGALV